jgi:hypothetical protein
VPLAGLTFQLWVVNWTLLRTNSLTHPAAFLLFFGVWWGMATYTLFAVPMSGSGTTYPAPTWGYGSFTVVTFMVVAVAVGIGLAAHQMFFVFRDDLQYLPYVAGALPAVLPIGLVVQWLWTRVLANLSPNARAGGKAL